MRTRAPFLSFFVYINININININSDNVINIIVNTETGESSFSFFAFFQKESENYAVMSIFLSMEVDTFIAS